MARFVRTGGLVYCTPGYDGAAVMALWDDVGIPYEWFDAAALRRRFPALDPGSFFPPKPVDDPTFADDASGDADRVPQRRQRLHRRPDAGRPQPGPRRRPPRRPVPLRPAVVGVSVPGRRPGRRRRARRRRHDRRAGRRQRRRPALGPAQRAGRRHGRHAHRPPRPAPGGVRRAGPARAAAGGRHAVRRRPRRRPVLPAPGRRHAARRRHGGRVRRAGVDRRPRPLRRGAVGRGLGAVDAAAGPAGADVRRAAPAGRAGRAVRRGRRLGADLRPLVARRVVHGLCDERQPVQERAAGRPVRARARRRRGRRHRPRRRAGAVPRPADRPRRSTWPRSPAAATRRRRPAP